MKSVIEILGWIVVWYRAPHHIGGGIVCLRTCSCVPGAHHSCKWPLANSLLAYAMHSLMAYCVLSRADSLHLVPRLHSLSLVYVASCVCINLAEQQNHRACVCVFVMMISYNNIMRAHKEKTEFWCFPRSSLVYLKPWNCFYIRLQYQRLQEKNGAKDLYHSAWSTEHASNERSISSTLRISDPAVN